MANIRTKLRGLAGSGRDEIKFLDFAELTIDGNTARARLLVRFVGSTTFDYVKEGRDWRLNLSAPLQGGCPISSGF